MKLSAARVDGFINAPPKTIIAALIYGPDRGLISERLESLSKKIIPDLDDPFLLSDLNPDSLKGDPALFLDEAGALSFTGARKLVRVREAPEQLAPNIASYLENPVGDCFVIITGGDLSPNSKLRQLFEKAENAAAIPCYADDAMAAGNIIRQYLKDKNVTITPDALSYLSHNISGDRGVLRMEAEKLYLYAHESGRLDIHDVMVVCGGTANANLDNINWACLTGKSSDLDKNLALAYMQNINSVTILRSVLRQFMRLYQVQIKISQGSSPDHAMDSLRPKVFFKQKPEFSLALRLWNIPLLMRAMHMLQSTEGYCKQTHYPAVTMTSRLMHQFAAISNSKKQSRS